MQETLAIIINIVIDIDARIAHLQDFSQPHISLVLEIALSL